MLRVRVRSLLCALQHAQQQTATCSFSSSSGNDDDGNNKESLVTQKQEPLKPTASGVRHKHMHSKLTVSKVAAELSPGDLQRQQDLSQTLLTRLSAMDTADDAQADGDELQHVLHNMTVDSSAHNAVSRPFRDFGDVLEVKGGRRLPGKSVPELRPAVQQQPLGRPLFAQPAEPLALFDPANVKPMPDNAFWNQLRQKRLKLVRRAGGPRNGWEQMIEWTEEGKMYPYPIDNEYQIGTEENVSFAEHILIERQLDELGFVRSGPVRDFMELVCVGLSKNPHMTIDDKIGHLEWYKAFFDAERIKSIDKLHAEQQQRAAVTS